MINTKYLNIIPKVLILITVFLVSFSVFSQPRTIEQVREGDFIFIKGKFLYCHDNSNLYKRKWLDFMFVDNVYRSPHDSLITIHLTDGDNISFTIYFKRYRFDYVDEINSYEELKNKATFTVCDTCRYDGNYLLFINNDSSAFYSTHPSKPFKYGETYSYKECLSKKRFFDFLEIKSGDSVASIGAASGWYEGAISVFTDSVFYRIQDVENKILNEKQLQGMVNYYSSVRPSPQTNTFDFTIGDYDKSNLPLNEKYDKIVINNAYHHFGNKWMMLNDLVKYLKPDGTLILSGESFSNLFYSNYHGGCNIHALNTDLILPFFARFGLYPVKFVYPKSSLDNIIIFSKIKNKSDAYLANLQSTEEIIFKTNRLYTSFYAKNLNYLNELENEFINALPDLYKQYDTLDFFVSDIGTFWMDQWKYDYAINILEIFNRIFPDKAYTNYLLGECYYWLEDDETAESFFVKALALEPDYREDLEELRKERTEWLGY
jgi:SAM-dependent methyltransferase